MDKTGLAPSRIRIQAGGSRTLAVNPSAAIGRGKISLPSTIPPGGSHIRRVVTDRTSGAPLLIEVRNFPAGAGNVIQSVSAASESAMHFLIENKALLKISDPGNEFLRGSAQTDELGMTHIRYKQMYQGIEVWAKEIYVHSDERGVVRSLTGRFVPTPESIGSLAEKINASSAVEIATADLNSRMTMTALSTQLQKLFNYSGPKVEKIIWHDKTCRPYLAWHIELRSGLTDDWYYFIDARTGAILNSYNNVCSDGPATASGLDLNNVNRTFGTYLAGGKYYMLDASEPMFNAAQSSVPGNPVGAIQSFDLQNNDLGAPFYYVGSTTNQWNDQSSVSAHFNAITTYRFFHSVFNRNSIDDNGMTVYSIIHVTENGHPMENAFWNGQVMCYGDGQVYFKPLAGGLDVGAHEMTHGVTQHTANLEYHEQSGALNEAMSDAFATLVDTANWTIGEQVIRDLTAFPSGALRSLSDPHNGSNQGHPGWQPASMSEYINTTGDNGGVHINSGIPNHAFYLVGTSIGRAKAGQIWYRALTWYLTRSSQFLDARIATEQSATDLFGSPGPELTAVKSAWDGVGVLEDTPPPPPPPTQLAGQNWILAANTDANDLNSLYMVKSVIQSPSDLSPLTQTPVLDRPAATDTSGIILFVDRNYNLRALNANPQNPQETLIDSSGVWWSVAIGPGLNNFALTSRFIDTTVYYFDLLDSTNSKAFKIRTSSYDAEDTKTALYADALSFDPTGQFLLFDTYNQMKSSSGDTLAFWNINLLDVRSGHMESVFPPFSRGIDVGNPTFSKTSPTRFAFDYVDENANRYIVMAADFNTGNVGVVADSNGSLGYPTYSGDDRTIAYHLLTTVQLSLHDAIQQMPLQNDGISGTGNPQAYLVDATFPVWFVIGSRVTAVEKPPPALPRTISLEQNYPNPFNPSTTIRYQLPKAALARLRIYNMLGQEVATLVDGMKQAGYYQVDWKPQVPGGVYFYRLESDGNVETKKLLLMK